MDDGADVVDVDALRVQVAHHVHQVLGGLGPRGEPQPPDGVAQRRQRPAQALIHRLAGGDRGGQTAGMPRLAVLDSTDPGAVLTQAERLDPAHTLFIVSTKSGGTVETLSFFKYFYNWTADALGWDRAGAHFVAITDPGSKLVDLAAVTNIVPYITSISALMLVMNKAGVSPAVYKRNVAVALAAIAYSIYALYASGMEAVFGGMMVMMLAYLLYGFVAKKYIGDGAPAADPVKE